MKSDLIDISVQFQHQTEAAVCVRETEDGPDMDDQWDDEAFKCPTCHGTGIANPLSPHLPKDALVLSATECPRCEGVGEF